MANAPSWTPNQPLRADATDGDVEARFRSHALYFSDNGHSEPESAAAWHTAREYAAACVAKREQEMTAALHRSNMRREERLAAAPAPHEDTVRLLRDAAMHVDDRIWGEGGSVRSNNLRARLTAHADLLAQPHVRSEVEPSDAK